MPMRLTHLAAAIYLVDTGGSIVHTNRNAAALLADGDVLTSKMVGCMLSIRAPTWLCREYLSGQGGGPDRARP